MRAAALFFLLVLSAAPGAHAGVVFHDALAASGSPVMLRAETRGLVFKAPGRIVEFKVNGETLGRTLSGGDGRAFMEFSPGKPGLYRVEAISGEESDRGLLLCVDRGDGLVLVEVSAGLMEDVLSRRPREGSVEAVAKIASVRPVAYVNTAAPARGLVRDWLRENGYPEAPLLEWAGGRLLDGIVEMGITVRAVVGGALIVGTALEHDVETYSFEEGSGAGLVKDWDEIAGALGKD